MRLVFVLLCLMLCASIAPVSAGPAPIAFTRLRLGDGAMASTLVQNDRLTLAEGQRSGTWTSAPISPGFAFTRLVASWNADTPADSNIKIEVQAATEGGPTDWYTLGVWAASDHAVQRTSFRGQNDTIAQVDTDTLIARWAPFLTYTLRATLERASAEDPSPSVRMLGAQVSDTAYVPGTATSAPLGGEAVELPVPSYSQEVHARQYPQYGGGGEAWCSPTSTEMVIEYWGRAPSADDLAWINPSYADPTLISPRGLLTTPRIAARATGPSIRRTRRALASTRSSRSCARLARPSCSCVRGSRWSRRLRLARAS